MKASTLLHAQPAALIMNWKVPCGIITSGRTRSNLAGLVLFTTSHNELKTQVGMVCDDCARMGLLRKFNLQQVEYCLLSFVCVSPVSIGSGG